MTKFDLDNPKLPKGFSARAMKSGDYVYDDKMDRDDYDDQLKDLQIELVKLQQHTLKTGDRAVLVFEGRDAAGKGGSINAFRANLNPRHARIVALSKPSDKEQGQWYFQRYCAELPTSGEIVLFDRSWYNRGVVEPVMGFCTPDQTTKFLDEAPKFEQMLVRDGIHLFKFWLNIGQEMQLKRFHARRHDPLKFWKLSPVDYRAMDRWDDYTSARDTMLEATDTATAPWTIVRANCKRRARLNLIRYVLSHMTYADKDEKAIGDIDSAIVMNAPRFVGLGIE